MKPIIKGLCMIILFGSVLNVLWHPDKVKGESVTITIEQEARNYSGAEVKYSLDGEVKLDASNVGMIFKGVCMVPCYGVLQNMLGAEVSYDEKQEEITIKKNSGNIVMQIGSTDAMVNEEKHILKVEPFRTSEITGGQEDFYVPAEFVAEYLDYGYFFTRNEKKQACVNFVSPVIYVENEKKCYYTGDKIKQIIYNGKKISMKSMVPGMEWNGEVMVPVEPLVKKQPISADVTQTETQVCITRGEKEIIFYKGSNIVACNGVEKNSPEMTREITYDGTTYYMVPAKFLFELMEVDKIEIEKSKEQILVEKKPDVYLDIAIEENEMSGNCVSNINAKYEKGKDCITITCADTPKIKVSSTKSKIIVKLKKVSIDETYTRKVHDAVYTKKMVLQSSGNDVVLEITKQKGVNYITQYGQGMVRVLVGATPIKVAVDCGHGANTPGKRSPKMPCSIDVDGDGKIDIKKGQSIREHYGNVGVGKYVASELERLGFQVYRSAFGKKDISLSKRQQNIRKFGAKYSVSIHFNAVGTGKKFTKAKGMEVFYHKSNDLTRESKAFAQEVLKEMAKGTPQINRGVKQQTLAMCNTKEMNTKASILVECAFMTNLHEAKTMFGKEKYWKETGEEIAKGICQYAKVPYVAK